jgi:hypothetical protein
MQQQNRRSAFFCFLLVLLFICCRKADVRYLPAGPSNPMGNKSPIALAGDYQTISLPMDSVVLDGSKSSDPDGKIRAWKWRKLSGSASFTIVSDTLPKTVVKDLKLGTYEFELKVTDDKGASATSTVQIYVVDDAIETISGNVRFMPFASLSQPKWVMPATAGDKVVFAGGVVQINGFITNDAITRSVDIYNLTTNEWSTATLGEPRNGLQTTTVGNKILFTSGEWNGNNYPKTIDIYDAAANTWSATTLPSPTPFINDAAIVTENNKVFIAAPRRQGVRGFSSSVDVYDVTSNSWSSTALSEGRNDMAAAAASNKVLFAGGYRHETLDPDLEAIPTDFSNEVNIYNLSTNTWTIENLTEARAGMVTAVVANKILFAGGYYTDKSGGGYYADKFTKEVDIYDATHDTWSTANLSEDRTGFSSKAVTIGSKVIFAGGSAKVDIYDAANNTWTIASLSQPRGVSSIVTQGNKVLFFTGESDYNVIDTYDAATNTWSSAQIDKSIISFAVSAGNQIFVGGGRIGSPGVNTLQHLTHRVWRLQF